MKKWLEAQGATGSRCEEDVYFVRKAGKMVATVLAFVDDIKALGEEWAATDLMSKIQEKFKCSSDGPLGKYVGLEFKRVNEGIEISQSSFAEQILDKFGMKDCNCGDMPTQHKEDLTKRKEGEKAMDKEDKTTFRSGVVSLMFLAINTRPDLCWITNILSQSMEDPTDRHMMALKMALRYIQKTKHHCLRYEWSKVNSMEVYSDSNWGVPRNKSGGVLFAWGNPVKWWTRRQHTVAMSTTEAELVGQAEAVRELRTGENFAKEALERPLSQATIYGDNAKTIDMSNGDCTRRMVKHLDLAEGLS